MIQKIISEIKKATNNSETNRLEAIHTIEHLLDEIDFSSEVVPTNDIEKLKNLLTNLKGDNLTSKEIEIAKEINIQTVY